MLVHETNLSATINAINGQLFEGLSLTQDEMERTVEFLLRRQVRSGRECGIFRPFPEEYETGICVPTGERLRTQWAVRNVITLEAARILSLFGEELPEVRRALSRTSMTIGHACFAVSHCVVGECAYSSIAYMRDAAVDRSGKRRKWIERQIELIAAHRDGSGRWRKFPFYYTLTALVEVGTPPANAELMYAWPACRRVCSRAATHAYSQLRQRIVTRVLEAERTPCPGR